MISRSVAEFIVGPASDFGHLPEGIVGKAKQCLLDYVGCAIAGSQASESKIIERFVADLGGVRESSVLVSGLKTCSPNAALANGVFGRSLELEDGYAAALCHPGISVIPASLALGESIHASGRQVLESIVVGYEVMIRVALAVLGSSSFSRAFHQTSVNGTFGATAAACRLLELDETKTTNALGLAAMFASGLKEGLDEAMTTTIYGGKAAQSGLHAALLARKGFDSPKNIFEGKFGFLAGYSEHPSAERITDGLGVNFETKSIYFKPYPTCGNNTAAIDATKAILAHHKLRPEDAEEIVVGGHEGHLKVNNIYKISSVFDAQYSLQYDVAFTLLKGDFDLDALKEESFTAPEITSLVNRTRIEFDDEIAKAFPKTIGSRVTIKMKNGDKYTHLVLFPKGTPMNPMGDEEFMKKFTKLSSNLITHPDEVVKFVRSMESHEDISEMLALLTSRQETSATKPGT